MELTPARCCRKLGVAHFARAKVRELPPCCVLPCVLVIRLSTESSILVRGHATAGLSVHLPVGMSFVCSLTQPQGPRNNDLAG